MSLYLLSPAESLKSMLTPFWSAKHPTRTVAVLFGQARTVCGLGLDGPPDGPRPGAGARVSYLMAGRSARAQGQRKIAGGAWISLPGRTPSGRRDPRSCLDSGRPTWTPLIGVESKRGEEFGDREAKLELD
jgi:hypothetical protein